MTPFQQAVFVALGSHAGLSAMVGARIYPDLAPQGVARPFVVWQEISSEQMNNLSGSVVTGGLANYLIQVSCWANTATMARDVAEQVQLAMIAATGFKSLFRDWRSLAFEPDTKLFGSQMDFSVWFKT